ncbi:antitoxin [Arthrobacter sp. RIT-PI-e]|uniref:antitoxin n=1 Tax=Arthrobacter sp. RIT-PI-e TaxID=1681197 RepID=UPI0009E2EBA6|nr:antitoxin [Arthrobacter sp. RIT-PI-e]
MGLFGRGAKGAALAAAAMGYVKKNPEKIKNGLMKAGDFANKKTHGKYTRQITGAQTKAAQAIDKTTRGKGNNGIDPTPPSNR